MARDRGRADHLLVDGGRFSYAGWAPVPERLAAAIGKSGRLTGRTAKLRGTHIVERTRTGLRR